MHLTDNVLYGEHNTKCYISVQYSCSRHYGYQYILYFVNQYCTNLLPLPKIQRTKVYSKQRCLYILPFPSFLPFTPKQLYVLHSIHKLHQIILIQGHLLKVFSVQVCTFLHEQFYPSYVEHAECQEYKEYFPAVYSQHNTENGYSQNREQDIQYRLCQKSFYGSVIFYTPYQVTGKLTVEEAHRKFHQFYEKIRYQSHIDSCTYM